MTVIQRFTSVGLSFLLAVCMILSPLTIVSAEEQIEVTERTINYAELVQSAINKASANIAELDYITEWQAIGLVRANKDVPSRYADIFKDNLEEQITKPLDTGRIKITDIERLAMAAVAIGKDPRDIEGHNLIELIYNSPDRIGGFDTMTFQGNNGPIFALIALDTKSFSVPADARWTRQKLVDELLRTQNEEGSWNLNDAYPGVSIDITAMAMIGLSNYKEQPKVKEALAKTAQYLSNVQTDEGGYDGGSFVGGITSEAASQVIIGLTANGIDPTSDKFTKNGINLIDHLLAYQAEDGGFKHTADGGSNAMATEQALQGLLAFNLYMKDEGKLYDFNDKIVEPEPDPEPKPEPKPEKTITIGEQVDVEKMEKLVIGDGQTSLLLPSDLPEGTTLEVSIPEKETSPYEGMELAGDWFDFNFHYPSGVEQGTESYQLSLGVNEGIDSEKTGIYYFNEQTKQWEYVGGWGTAKDGTITIDVDHFSIYGVFTDTDGPSDIQITEQKTTADSITVGLAAQDPSGIKEYIIYRDGEQIATVDGSATEFVDTDLKPDQEYNYTVVVVDGLGNESEGIILSAKTITQPKVDDEEESDEIPSGEESANDLDYEGTKGQGNSSSEENESALSKGEEKGHLLPKTATNTFNLLLIGIVLLTIGGIALFIRRKNVFNP